VLSVLSLHPDRLLPVDPATRDLARALYTQVKDLPIISPHGHTDPEWFATNANFGNAAELLLHPDHYVFRMLYSQGVALADLGIGNPAADPRTSWRLFAERYFLFRGTPSRMWLDWVFAEVFGMGVQLCAETSDLYFDTITEMLASAAFRPPRPKARSTAWRTTPRSALRDGRAGSSLPIARTRWSIPNSKASAII
jgi:glucuronate isomerase